MAPVIEPFPATIDRSLLHVFVFGADTGEAVAVALPGRGWILVDGCELDVDGVRVFPALEAYLELRDGDGDPIDLLVWTHPHADHYQGIREIIERYQPLRIGMTLVEAPAPGSLSKEIETLGSHPTLPADLRLQDVFKRVRSTLERVFFHWREKPDSRLPLSAQSPALNLGATRVCAFSPDRDALSAFYGLGIDSLRAALKGRANEHSIVLGLEFGKTQIVLGGDLPHRSRNGSILPHGWKYWKWIETSAPQLSSHHAFKVSHHGSAEAIPPFFRRVAEPPPEWLVTPFVREHLPRFGDDETGGLRQLLRCVPEVRLTSSVGLVVPPIPGAHVLRSVLHTRFAQVQERGFLGGLRAPSATNAFDFAWGVSFDAEGIRRHLFAGRQAITAVETIAS